MVANLEEYFFINGNTLEELNTATSPGFPFFSEHSVRESYPRGTYPWHWHTTVHFFYMTEGRLKYHTTNGAYIFQKGHGGFINANLPHMLEYLDDQPTSFFYCMFSPELIGGNLQSDIMSKYVRPITDNSDFDIFHLDCEQPSHARILQLLKEAFALYDTKPSRYELLVSAKLLEMWALFDEVTAKYRTNLIGKMSSSRIKLMITYLNEHFIEKVTLDEIAAAGMCSRRECNRTFQTQLHTTPFEYLLNIRLQQACQYLVNSSHSITDISISCGFSSTSYFTKLFREKFGCSPREYRRHFQPKP